MEKTFCKKCELDALQKLLTPENIKKEVEKMPFVEGVTTPSAEYGKRLESCAECPALTGRTTCLHSGSLVAYRAKIKNAVCPFPGKDRWHS